MRYVTRNVAQFVDDCGETSMTCDTVIEEDSRPTPIGLIDQYGVPLYRVHDKVEMGFHTTRKG